MSTLTAPKSRKYTYRDYLLLDDEVRYEIIEGDLQMTPAPTLEHQGCSRNLGFLFWNFFKDRNVGVMFCAPVDVVLDDANVVQPDIVFVAKENAHILQKQAITGSPDLIVEIISPSTLHKDRHQKKALYEKFGIKEYWLVDPANRTIEVFSLKNDRYTLHAIASEKGGITSKIIENFAADIEGVFNPLIP